MSARAHFLYRSLACLSLGASGVRAQLSLTASFNLKEEGSSHGPPGRRGWKQEPEGRPVMASSVPPPSSLLEAAALWGGSCDAVALGESSGSTLKKICLFFNSESEGLKAVH